MQSSDVCDSKVVLRSSIGVERVAETIAEGDLMCELKSMGGGSSLSCSRLCGDSGQNRLVKFMTLKLSSRKVLSEDINEEGPGGCMRILSNNVYRKKGLLVATHELGRQSQVFTRKS